MIKAALEYIASLKEGSIEPVVMKINDKTYCNKDLIRYDGEIFARAIEASTLTSLIDYIKNKPEEMKESMIVHIVNPKKVKLYSGLTKEREREYLFESNALVQEFQFDRWYDQERFLIELQANFEVTPELESIIKVAGNIEVKATANYGDDGMSQKTTIKQGVASKVDVIVPNPVLLVPYRTFQEIEQPASEFVFRIKEDGNGTPTFKLVEAEGNLWVNEAMRRVKAYIETELDEVLKERNITVIA